MTNKSMAKLSLVVNNLSYNELVAAVKRTDGVSLKEILDIIEELSQYESDGLE